MADSDYSLLVLLKADYPTLPNNVVIRVMKKFENDEEKCRQALNSEVDLRRNNSDNESSPTALRNTNICNNLENPSDGKLVTSRIKEFQKPHENSPQPRTVNQERHVTTIERSIGNVPRSSEQTKRPLVGQSVSWTVQTPDRPSHSTTQSKWASSGGMATPQTAPPDFTPFFSHSAKDIPNINCNTSGFGAGSMAVFGTRPQQISVNSSSTSSSPMEQRHPIKVINIPPGSLSGGSVSPAATPPNARHIHMHFGDTGGVCTISAPPSTLQHYGSTPNINQQYKSEIRTEAPAPPPLHSSSIVVNTSSHTNNLVSERKLSAGNNGSDSSFSGKLTPNSPLSFRTGDIQPSFGSSSGYSSGKLSTPVQATSPGITHSKPVFVEIKTDRVPSAQMQGAFNDNSYNSDFYLGTGVRPPPSSSMSYMPHQSGSFNSQGNHLNYNNQYGTEFPNAAVFPHYQHKHMYPQNPQHKMHPGYNSPPTNLYQPTTSTGYSPPTVMGYPFTGVTSAQMPTHLYYAQYGLSQGHSSGMHIPKNPIGHQSLGSRSSSLDSEHNFGTDYDPRHPPYNAMGSRVSSHSSLSSDSSSSHLERKDFSARPRSGSLQDDAEYIRALVQHQRSHVQKLLGEMNQHRIILENLRSEVSLMEKSMIEASHASRNYPSIEDISRLCEKNRQLQTDIQLYMNDIDMYKTGQTPVNKINPHDQQNFFDNMPTGQQDPIYLKSPDGRASPPRPIPPPRPPPPLPARQRSTDPMQSGSNVISTSDIFRVPPVPPAQPVINSGDSEEGESWSCSACTFSNHPALKKCEMCEMPRVLPHHLATPIGPPMPPPHQAMSPLPPRLPSGLVGGGHHRSTSPHSALSHHHHHHAGT